MHTKYDIRKMLEFAEYIFTQGSGHLLVTFGNGTCGVFVPELILSKRLAVVNIAHSVELIFKAVMLKHGYTIQKLKHPKVIKEDAVLRDLLEHDRME